MRGFAIFGTPEYMAPEQVAGDDVDGRTDVYSLGCVLYEMLTGKRAFDGPSSVVVMGKQLRDTPRPPRVQAGDRSIPPALDALVMRAMKKSPAERFPSAEALCAALEETVAAPARKAASMRKLVSVVGFGAAMLVAAAGSAQWARAHASALDVPLPSASASPAPLAIANVAPVTAPPPQAFSVAAAAPIAPATTPPSPLVMTVPVSALPRDTRGASHARSGSKSPTVVHLEHASTPAHELARR
jgi:serine/threonine-protein kinase